MSGRLQIHGCSTPAWLLLCICLALCAWHWDAKVLEALHLLVLSESF
jgi:hypothetical protein